MSITVESAVNTKVVEVGGGGASRGLADIGGGKVEPTTQFVAMGTDVNFSSIPSILPSMKTPGLSDIRTVPKNFNWRNDPEKGPAIAKPGNQGLCGSCWAISSAGIIADNFVVTGMNEDDKGDKFIPDLSTTWILVKYPQNRCGGGNPALAFTQIADDSDSTDGGVVSNRCIDYSWCMTRDECNGKATRHMDVDPTTMNDLIPQNPGCYDSRVKHFLFKLYKEPNSVGIGMKKYVNGRMTDTTITEQEWPQYKIDIKKHIYSLGPVLGGFLVFNNFMKGDWCKTKANKGIYLEKGVYDSGENITFDDKQVDVSNFKGSHAVAIIGWGVEDDVDVGNGKKESVEYWYCRNSWTDKWGDDGYFKMAMWPHNQISQFDKVVTINSSTGPKQAGGIVMIEVTQKPEILDLAQVNVKKGIVPKTIQDKSYYSLNATANTYDSKPGSSPGSPSGSPSGSPAGSPSGSPSWSPTTTRSGFSGGFKKIFSNIYVYIGILVTLCITFVLYFFFSRKKNVQKKYQLLFVSAMFVLTMILLLVIYLANKN